jgi:hypothetical protein
MGFGNVPSMLGDFFGPPPHDITCLSFEHGTSNVKLPAISSATAGEEKLADGTSPIPRDRIIFDYEFFDKVPLVPGGVNVNRFIAGFEKTIFSDRFSVELQVPFATTLDHDQIFDNNGTELTNVNSNAVEFGNVAIWTKALFYRTETLALSGGLGVRVPTASDINVSLPGDQNLYQVINRSPHLLPFIGGVWTPNERCFTQAFLQFDVDTDGNPVRVGDGTGEGTTTPGGTLHDPPVMYLDISTGYWIFHDPPCSCNFVTGLAALFEVHFNQSLGNYGTVIVPLSSYSGSEFTPDPPSQSFVGTGTGFTSLNLTAGFTVEIQDNALLSFGATVPTIGGSGHDFDYEFRVNFNYLFGRSTKGNRSAAAGVPSTL